MTLLFVAGAHTDVGKTFVACQLLRTARLTGRRVDAFKPVLSGFDEDRPQTSDAGRLLEAMARPQTTDALQAVSPLRFAAPLAPPLAARKQGFRLTRADLRRRCRSWLGRTRADLGLIEGAGGVMSPIAEDATNLDLIEDLALPVLLVGGSYLGAISHTLTAVEALRNRGVAVAALVISEATQGGPDLCETVALTRRFAGDVPTFAAPWRARGTWNELYGLLQRSDRAPRLRL